MTTFSKLDACDVTLSVYPQRAGLENMPGHGGNRTYDLWNTSPSLFIKLIKQLSTNSRFGQLLFSIDQIKVEKAKLFIFAIYSPLKF